jgi:hypothetical protein
MHITQPQSLLGLDLGRHKLDLSYPDGGTPKKWQTVTIDLRDPDWFLHFVNLVAADALIVAEPTGWHMLTPIVTCLRAWRPLAQLILINTTQTKKVRSVFIASSKTDAMDARALAYVALKISQGEDVIGQHKFDHHREAVVGSLRLKVNSVVRVQRTATRATNQIAAFGHSLWPLLAQKKATWIPLAARGIVTPHQVKTYVAEKNEEWQSLSGIARHHISKLADQLPDIDGDPTVVTAIVDLANMIYLLEQEERVLLADIEQRIHQAPFAQVTSLWETAPGCGSLLIAALHVASSGRAQELTADQMKSACGVSPLANTSGSVDNTRKNRKGYRPAMALLHLATMACIGNGDNVIADYYTRTKDMPATKAKLVRVLSGIARSGTPYMYNPPISGGQRRNSDEKGQS